MLQEFKKHIDSKLSFLGGKKLLLTISGGVDSVVLTHLLYEFHYDIEIAHCNFQLRRKESDEDHVFVRELAEKMAVPFHEIRFETKKYATQSKLSIQMAARKLRYDWFDKIMEENQCDYIITGHHADDNLETFLINLIRGTGLEGIHGIPEVNGNKARPMLPFSREQIIAYAEENNIVWREDSSNISTKYLRNKLRHDVIPVLKELNLTLLDSFKDTLHHLNDSQDIVDHAIDTVKEDVVEVTSDYVKIDLKKLNKYPNPKAYLYPLLKSYGFTSWKDIRELIDSQSGKQIFSDQSHIIKDRDAFLIRPRMDVLEKETVVFELTDEHLIEPIGLRWTNVEGTKKVSRKEIFVDQDKLKNVSLRKWKDGDVIYPKGMHGKKKKLSKYFKDEKMSLFDKESTWLLCSDDEIVWVIGKRQDHRFEVNKQTSTILKFEWYEK